MKLISLVKGITIGMMFFAAWACSSDKKDAQKLLEDARVLYRQGEYVQAKKTVDSLKSLYPKSFDQINQSFVLVDSIRQKQNEETINQCDSLIKVYRPVIDSVKKYFIYQRNKEYQETGFYIYKTAYTGEQLTGTTLRAGVDEKDGGIYVESVFIGNHLHDRIKVSAKDGSYVESLPVTGEGLNFRFSNMGKQYEIIKFAGKDDNGVAGFIAAHADKPITVFLSGGNNDSYTLPNNAKTAILKTYELSTLMRQLDSLKTEKEKAEYKIYYIKTKGQNPTTSK